MSVYKFYDRGEYSTASKLRKIMEKKTGFSGSQSSVLRLLKKVSFRYGSYNVRRKSVYGKKRYYCNTCGIS
jgi:hypothetical protein